MLKFREWLMTESLGDEESLLKAFLMNPKDYQILLVYADWLDEHPSEPNTALAEFIRLAVDRRGIGSRRSKAGQVPKSQMNQRIKELLPRIRVMARDTGVTQMHTSGDPCRYTYTDLNEPGEDAGTQNNYATVYYHPHGHEGTFSRTYPDGGQSDWVPIKVEPHGFIRTRRLPYGLGNSGIGPRMAADNPLHPSKWDHPYEGDRVQKGTEVLRGLLIRMVINLLPSHLGGIY